MKKVNFLEAINSGKRFKPVNQDDNGWLYIDRDDWGSEYVYWNGNKQFLNLDYLNDEYELEEKKIEISESEFDKAIKKWRRTGSMVTLKKELGF